MWRHPLLKLLFACYVAWGGWHWYLERPVRDPDGVLAPDDPVQADQSAATTLQVGRWTLTGRASYSITARILARESYRFDAISDLVPLDLALGWGPMSDNRNLRSIDISQSNRFYYWHTRVPPIALQEIVAHSANTHVIPKNALIAKLLSHVRPGHIVTLTGELVDARRSDGAIIRTSLVRTDTGAGACEVMLVNDVVIH